MTPATQTVTQSATQTMQAVRIHRFGGAETLILESVAVPEPKTGEVLVRVHASSVNPMDLLIRDGKAQQMMPVTLPIILGGDVAGQVAAVGPDVISFKVGDDVYGTSGLGAYAAYVAVPVANLARKPSTLDYVRSGVVPTVAQTAWQALFDHGKLQAGQTVLIHGAAGGVGAAAVLLAKWKQARVIASDATDRSDYLRRLGADTVIAYQTTRFEDVAHDVDLVLDLVGGETQDRSFGVLKQGGILVATAAQPSPEKAAQHNVKAEMMIMQPSGALLAQLADLLDAGKLEIAVDQVFPLSQTRQAYERFSSGQARGKVAIQIAD